MFGLGGLAGGGGGFSPDLSAGPSTATSSTSLHISGITTTGSNNLGLAELALPAGIALLAFLLLKK